MSVEGETGSLTRVVGGKAYGNVGQVDFLAYCS